MFRQLLILVVLVLFVAAAAYAEDKWIVQKFESQAMGAAGWNSGWGPAG